MSSPVPAAASAPADSPANVDGNASSAVPASSEGAESASTIEVSKAPRSENLAPDSVPSATYSARVEHKVSSSAPDSAATARRPSIRKNGAVRRVRRLLRRYYDWKSAHQYLGRYSVEKLLTLEEYQEMASPLRVFAVIALTPLPSLLVILFLAVIPLNNPLLGVSKNPTYFVQAWFSYSTMTFSLLLFIRRALNFPSHLYSHRDALTITLFTTACNEIFMLGMSLLWRFPIPFRDVLGVPSYSVFLVIFHKLVIGSRLRHYREQMRKYAPLIMAQSSTLFIFKTVSIIFSNVPVSTQAVITVLFPVVRGILKRWIWSYTHCLEDISTDVSVCVVEIFGSLFQNVCLQSARGPEIGALIVLVDFIQAIVEARMYLEHKFIVDGRQAIPTAGKIVDDALCLSAGGKKIRDSAVPGSKYTGTSSSSRNCSVMMDPNDVFGKPEKLALPGSRSSARMSRVAASTGRKTILDLGTIEPDMDNTNEVNNQPQPQLPAPASTALRPKLTIDNVQVNHREHAKLLSQTLQLLFASEVMIFAEYSEFACSVIYGVYMLAIYHLPYAKYNTTCIGLEADVFWEGFGSTMIYAALEGLSFVFLFALVRAKYGFSTFYQLAFMLEKYWMTIQGKILGSMSLIFILNTVHNGIDLSLKFDWEKVLNGTSGI